MSFSKALQSKEEHTIVKGSEQSHGRSELGVFVTGGSGVCHLTIMAAANNERVRVRVC